MILETTNPKYKQPPQVPAVRKIVVRNVEHDDNLGSGSWSKDRASGRRERNFHEHDPESDPRPIPKGSSIWIADESPDAPLWLILDRVTGVTFARVRGSLPHVVSQIKLVAHQLGGQERDLYYQFKGHEYDA